MQEETQTQTILEFEDALTEALAWITNAQNNLTDQFKQQRGAGTEATTTTTTTAPTLTATTTIEPLQAGRWQSPHYKEAYDKLEAALTCVEEALCLIKVELDQAEENLLSLPRRTSAKLR